MIPSSTESNLSAQTSSPETPNAASPRPLNPRASRPPSTALRHLKSSPVLRGSILGACLGLRHAAHPTHSFSPTHLNGNNPLPVPTSRPNGVFPTPNTPAAFLRTTVPTEPALAAHFEDTPPSPVDNLTKRIEEWSAQYTQNPKPLIIAIDPIDLLASDKFEAIAELAKASHNTPDSPSIGVLCEGLPSIAQTDRPWEHGLEEHYSMQFRPIAQFIGWSTLPYDSESIALTQYKAALATGQWNKLSCSGNVKPLLACAAAFGQMASHDEYGKMMQGLMRLVPRESRELVRTLGTIAPAFSREPGHTNQAFSKALFEHLANTPNWDQALQKLSQRFMEITRFGMRMGFYQRKLPNKADILQAISGALNTDDRRVINQSVDFFRHDLRHIAFKDNLDAFKKAHPDQAPLVVVTPAHADALNAHLASGAN